VKHRILILAATIAASTGAAVAVTTASVGASPARLAAAATGFPSFTVVSEVSSLEVFDTSTGVAVGTVAAPAGLEFEGVASGGTSQTFLAYANPVSVTAACHAYYYRFRLTAAGQPQGLTVLRSIAGSTPTAIAASPGGGTYTYSATGCDTGNGVIGISGQAGNHTWAYDQGDNYTFSLAATAGAKELALSLMDRSDNWADLLLNAGSGAATVDGASRVVPAVPFADSLAISPDGATLYACVSSDTTGRGQVAAYSAATGKLIRVLYRWTLAVAGTYFCQVSADATGTDLLAGYSSNLAPHTSLIAINPQAGTAVKLPVRGNLVAGVAAAW
jgi:hypothetical protein